MKLQPTSSAFTVQLSEKALRIAAQFQRYHSHPPKARKVYQQTLAVYAVSLYLQLMGWTPDLEASHSWNPLIQALLDVGDLEIKNYGKIECRAVLPEAEFVYIPREVWCDRSACVVVEINESSTDAVLLGFLDQAETEKVPLSQLRSLEELSQHLNQKNPVRLSSWLDNMFGAGWQSLEDIFHGNQFEPAFAFRSPLLLKKGKILNLQGMGEELALVVGLKPSITEIDVSVEVYPTGGYTRLPEDLKLMVLDEEGKSVMQADARRSEGLEFQFSGEQGEQFSVKVVLGEMSITEQFLI